MKNFKSITDEEFQQIDKGYVIALASPMEDYGLKSNKIYKVMSIRKARSHFGSAHKDEEYIYIQKDEEGTPNGYHFKFFSYLGLKLTPAMKILYEKC